MSLVLWHELLQWAAIIGVAFMLAGVLYLLADIRRRLGPDYGAQVPNNGLAVGATAPDFSTHDRRTGRSMSLSDYHEQRMIVAFLSPRCEPCKALLPHLNRLATSRPDLPVVVVATDGAGVEYAREFSDCFAVVDDAKKEIQQAFEVAWTPLVYLLDEERRVVNRTISNSLIDREDTLDGKGRAQSTAWVPTESIRGRPSTDSEAG